MAECKPVIGTYEKTGEEIHCESIRKAAIIIGTNRKNIRDCLTGRKRMRVVKGYSWRYKYE
jgi:hypothetical protein